jgi:predicted GIY-YIG superfamily endonuclease
MFPALKAHHQEVSCNNTGIIMYVYVCGESSMCGYTGITMEIVEHIKVHMKNKYLRV